MSRGESGSRRARWLGLVGLACRRLLGRTGGGLNRVTLAVSVVGLTVALLVVVTGISVGLTTQATVSADDVDYWITPDAGTSLTSVVSVRGPQLGDVHPATAEIRAIDGVRTASPVLVEILRLRAPDSTEPEYVLGVGVVPPEGGMRVAGLSTDPLRPGDPRYGTGEYDGEVTGEVVLSPAAATLLNASAGDALAVGSPATGAVRYADFEVTAVDAADARPLGGNVPVAVVHLSELQELSGAARADQADQLLVRTDAGGLKAQLAGVYPDATVVARGSLDAGAVLSSDLPLAMGVAALVITVVVAGLFVATTMGLEVETDRRFLAVLAAVGVSRRGRLLVVAATTVALAALGGIVGVALGAAGIVGLNAGLTAALGLPAVAHLHPLLVAYGLAVALLTGLLAVPYPLLVARGTATSEVLARR